MSAPEITFILSLQGRQVTGLTANRTPAEALALDFSDHPGPAGQALRFLHVAYLFGDCPCAGCLHMATALDRAGAQQAMAQLIEAGYLEFNTGGLH